MYRPFARLVSVFGAAATAVNVDSKTPLELPNLLSPYNVYFSSWYVELVIIFRADIRANLWESLGRFINMMSQKWFLLSLMYNVIVNVKATAQDFLRDITTSWFWPLMWSKLAEIFQQLKASLKDTWYKFKKLLFSCDNICPFISWMRIFRFNSTVSRGVKYRGRIVNQSDRNFIHFARVGFSNKMHQSFALWSKMGRRRLGYRT